MALRTVLKINGDEELLRRVARPVTAFDEHLGLILDDLKDTMYTEDGVGLAAPQVGILRRIAVVDVGDENGLTELINPEIILREGSQVGPEACLSVPDRSEYVDRPYRVTVKSADRTGKTVTYSAEGFRARAFCHEIDHLDGVLYIDKKMSPPKDGEEYR